jgi:hypothetical protein
MTIATKAISGLLADSGLKYEDRNARVTQVGDDLSG